MKYYLVTFISKKENYYFIWTTSDNEIFLTKDDKLIFWKIIKDVEDFMVKNNIVFSQNDEIVFDLDCFEKWCCSSIHNVDCENILNLWNIFTDLYSSVNKKYIGSESEFDEIYEKLFYGNNLQTVNTTNKHYIPTFSDDEIDMIKEIIMEGICFFKNIIK